MHFFQKIPDTTVAVSPVEYPIGPQALLGDRAVRPLMADDFNAVRENADLNGLPYIVALVVHRVTEALLFTQSPNLIQEF